MDSKNTNFRNALRNVIATVNAHSLRAVRADEVRAYGWPRSDRAVWAAMVSEAGVRTLNVNGESYLVVG